MSLSRIVSEIFKVYFTSREKIIFENLTLFLQGVSKGRCQTERAGLSHLDKQDLHRNSCTKMWTSTTGGQCSQADERARSVVISSGDVAGEGWIGFLMRNWRVMDGNGRRIYLERFPRKHKMTQRGRMIARRRQSTPHRVFFVVQWEFHDGFRMFGCPHSTVVFDRPSECEMDFVGP